MKVEIHTLFEYLLDSTQANPDAMVGLSLAPSPALGEFLADLDPNLSLDWNNRDFKGLPELRARVLAQSGLADTCVLDDVLITAGAAEANYLAVMQLLEPGDEVVSETPGWPQIEVLAKAKGVRLRSIAREERAQWVLPMERLSEAVNDRTRLIFLTNPNNPTGRVFSTDDLKDIVRIARRVGAWVLVDEVYAGLEWSCPRAPSIAGLYERGITTGSVSKALGLQGLRTGWLVCRNPGLIRDAVILRENSSEITNILGEVIAEIALRPDRLEASISKTRAQAQANLARLDRFIGDSVLTWVPPDAGLIGLARLPDGLDSDTFARRLLKPPYKTFILPGSAYHQPHHIRVGVGGAPDKLDIGLTRIAQALKDLSYES